MGDVTQRLAAPSLAFDLPAEIHTLRRAAASHKGSVGRTFIKEPDFRLVLTVIKAGYRCERHRTSANLYCGPWADEPTHSAFEVCQEKPLGDQYSERRRPLGSIQ
jgi:hypothetical protein